MSGASSRRRWICPSTCTARPRSCPERRSLADVRKGEFEGLREAVASGDRLPDFGPHEIGRAGATAVGARKPLIAFNIYLSGTDEAGAKDIARSVRESSGGLAAVRAIGFAVPERRSVTVSMNLVDFEVTGVREAFDAVAKEAAAKGMEILESEIVGLAPEAALPPGDERARPAGGILAERADPGTSGGSRLKPARVGKGERS